MDQCQDAGFSSATCSAFVGYGGNPNPCSISAAIPLAIEPWIGRNTLDPWANASATRGLHFEGDRHDAHAESKAIVDETWKARRASARSLPSSPDDGTVSAYISIESLTIQTRYDSLKSSDWNITYHANDELVFQSHGSINGKGEISVTGDIGTQLFTSFLMDDLWTLELSSPYYNEVEIGVIYDPGGELDVDVDVDLDATLTARDSLGSRLVPTVSEWTAIGMALLLVTGATIVFFRRGTSDIGVAYWLGE